jgi:hypothetical protein
MGLSLFALEEVKMLSIDKKHLRSSVISRVISASPAPIPEADGALPSRSATMGISIGRFFDIGDSLESRIPASSNGPLDYYYYHYPRHPPRGRAAPDIQAA